MAGWGVACEQSTRVTIQAGVDGWQGTTRRAGGGRRGAWGASPGLTLGAAKPLIWNRELQSTPCVSWSPSDLRKHLCRELF